MVNFFSSDQEAAIIDAIRQAELATSGEIRVHLEMDAKRGALVEAQRVFNKLGMQRTKDRNGVLILLEPDRKEFAVIGDSGINEVVPKDFWDESRNLMQEHFRRGDFVGGLLPAIARIGAQLSEFFPYDAATDTNELPDDISYGNQ